MSYCTQCGSQLAAGARFCTSCGTPAGAAAAAPAAQTNPGPTGFAEAPEQPHAVPPVQNFGQAQNRTAYAARPASNAFASVPVSDYVRDGLAVFLLLISMFMVWTHANGQVSGSGSVAATRIDVILITLVSMISVAIPYLWRSGVFGPAWDYRRTQQARLAANAPYFVLAVVYLILELVNRNGLGPAMAFGLAGAVLAAQPRRAELGSGAADAAADKRWALALLGLAGVVGVLTLIQVIERMTLFPVFEWASTLATVLLAAANVALLVWTAIGVGKGHNTRRLVGIGIGVAGIALGLLALVPTVTVASLTFHGYSPDFSIFFWLAFGALASSPSIARLCPASDPQDHHGALARTSTIATLAIIDLGLVAVVSALVLVTNATYSGFGVASNTVPWVVVIFLAVVGVVGGFVLKPALKQHTRQSYILTAGYAAVLFILGLVMVIMSATALFGTNGILGLLAAFALPIALVLSMFGSSARREAFRAAGNGSQTGFTFERPAAEWDQPETTTAAHAFQPNAHFQQEAPAQNVAGGSVEAHGVSTAVHVDDELAGVLAESADPSSPPARLYEIAAQYPPARPLIAGNPAAYPALLTWLAEQRDPEIDAALAQRPE